MKRVKVPPAPSWVAITPRNRRRLRRRAEDHVLNVACHRQAERELGLPYGAYTEVPLHMLRARLVRRTLRVASGHQGKARRRLRALAAAILERPAHTFLVVPRSTR